MKSIKFKIHQTNIAEIKKIKSDIKRTEKKHDRRN